MMNVYLVNSLTGLLILTSLFVIEAKRPQRSALLYSLQSIVLVLIFLALGVTMKAQQLFLWAALAFVTKAVLVPWILYRALSAMEEVEIPKRIMSPAFTVILAAAAIAVSYSVVDRFALRTAEPFKPALAVSVAHFFFGQLCILTQRNILKQVLGFCLMENGSHLTLAIMAYNAPELAEIGIATDAVFGVVIMVILGTQIYKKLHTVDAAQLTSLKG